MATETQTKEYTFDATGLKLGRLATDIAQILMGKNDPSARRHVVPAVSVVVSNAGQMNVSDKKAATKEYTRYTQYPGGLRRETLGDVAAKKGHAEVLRRAVKGMLPKNKLQSVMLKNLTITE